MPFELHSAVGYREKESLAKVKCGVHSHAKPEIPGAPQCKTENQAYSNNAGHSGPALARIPAMHHTERDRERYRGGPEPDSLRQRVLRIRSEERRVGKECRSR